jgi:inner membrane protein
MLGKTHFTVGMAAGLLFVPSHSLPELIVGAGAAAVGSMISDIDVGTSESHKDADRITAAVCLAIALVVVVEEIWHIGIYQRLMANSNAMRIIAGLTGFLALCIYGKSQSHRTFMHSLTACVLLTVCVNVFFPMAAPYFGVAFLSHLVLDLLNKKKEQIFWPAKKGICLGWCSSRGIVNKLLMTVGSFFAAGIFWFRLAQILGGLNLFDGFHLFR